MAQFYSAKRRVTTRQIITVTVNDLDPFGQGVARHNGKALFINGLLPEESAEITLTEEKKQYARGQVKRRLSSSSERETRVARILCGIASNSMPRLHCNSAVNVRR